MTDGEPNIAKLDDGLIRLLKGEIVAASERLPIIAMVREADGAEAVVDAIKQLGGDVRHVLRRQNTVAAWLRLERVPELSNREEVAALELDQTVVFA